MKRLVRNNRGEVSHGPKWQNTESSSYSENDDDLPHSPTITTAHEDNEDRIPIGKRVEVTDGKLMYVAALQGDWVAAEVLLDRDPKLAYDYITEEGDRALHVAAAMKHKEFVEKLVARMSDEELVLLNGHGYTACCYAAMSGIIEIARVMLDKNPGVVTARDEEHTTPLHKAALRGNKGMLSFLLGYTKDEDLSREEWFDLLLVAIRGKLFDVALDILGKNGSIAKMANEEGTALHLLARQETRMFRNSPLPPMTKHHPLLHKGNLTFSFLKIKMFLIYAAITYEESKLSQLVKKLWGEMQEMETACLLELMEKPVHILHDAAKAGQVEIITMLTCSYPQLIWETDIDGYTMFHIAVLYRQSNVFSLIHQVEAMIGFRTMWQDLEVNCILHLAAKPPAVAKEKLSQHLQIQKELIWFKVVERIVPLSCATMKNRKGLTPGDLFSKTHKKIFKESELGMRNAADSGMLIATILLTVVFAAAFTVPGGYESQIGEPILAKKKWFKGFVVSEVLGFIFSVLSVILFRCIMASSFAEDYFLFKLPLQQAAGFYALFLSLAGAVSSFMLSILLFNLNMNAFVGIGFCMLLYLGLLWSSIEYQAVSQHTRLKQTIGHSTHSLFNQNPRMGWFRLILTRSSLLIIYAEKYYVL